MRPKFLTATLICFMLLTGVATAKTTWSRLRPAGESESLCLRVSDKEIVYSVLGVDDPLPLVVKGPLRIRIISRFVFSGEEGGDVDYRLRYTIDGEEGRARLVHSRALEGLQTCDGGNSAVAALRKTYISIPAGSHELAIYAETEASGRVVARFFRERGKKKVRWGNFAPEDYESVYSLQYGGGKVTTYYHFTADRPLRVDVAGPTTLQIYTRLDFTYSMRGKRPYRLQVLIDGKPVGPPRVFYTVKQGSVSYRERSDILPGVRKTLSVEVPRGKHRVELRCIEPDGCGVAAKVRIPVSDLKKGR